MDIFKVQAINRHKLLTDGEGVTTLVGLIGCPLKCKYCINKNVLSIDKYFEFTPEELLNKVMIDYCYFISTGGGLVFGGGESLIHSEIILKFIDILPEGISVILETSLNFDTPYFEKILEKADHFIIDIKSLNDEIYKEYTGISSKLMKEHLDKIVELKLQDKCRIRIPIIPNLTTKEIAHQDADKIRKMGFNDIEVFPYVIRDYM